MDVDEIDASIRSGKAVCPYCGVGCVITAKVRNNKIVKIGADKNQAPNFGMLCPKGAYLKEVFEESGRLKYPLIRRHRGMAPTPCFLERSHRLRRGKALGNTKRTRAGEHRFLRVGPTRHRGVLSFHQTLQGLFPDEQHGHQQPPLHVERGGRPMRRSFGSDAPPTCYDDIPARPCHPHHRCEHGGESPGPLPDDPQAPREGRKRARRRRRSAFEPHSRVRGHPRPPGARKRRGVSATPLQEAPGNRQDGCALHQKGETRTSPHTPPISKRWMKKHCSKRAISIPPA